MVAIVIGVTMLSEVVHSLIIFLFACFLHELGHILHHRWDAGYYPKIKFNFFGVYLDSDWYRNDATIHAKMANIVIAYFVGVSAFFFLFDKTALGAYVISSMFDFFVYLALFYYSIKRGNIHIRELEVRT